MIDPIIRREVGRGDVTEDFQLAKEMLPARLRGYVCERRSSRVNGCWTLRDSRGVDIANVMAPDKAPKVKTPARAKSSGVDPELFGSVLAEILRPYIRRIESLERRLDRR